jgi:hypothetical protein
MFNISSVNSGRELMMHEYTSHIRTSKRFWRKEGELGLKVIENVE